jgi:hypothetical protein
VTILRINRSVRMGTPQLGEKTDRAANVDPCRIAGGPASLADGIRRSPVALRHRLSTALL